MSHPCSAKNHLANTSKGVPVSKVTTIHQPDFLPWFGFFVKIARADTWVVLDHVENNPRQASLWCRRVQILVNGQAHWLSVTLDRPREPNRVSIPLNRMTISRNQPKTWHKQLRTFDLAYSRSKFYEENRFLIEDYFLCEEVNLVSRNMSFIRSVMGLLEIDTSIIMSSELSSRTSSNQLLIDLLKETGGNTYLHGSGARAYQVNELFNECGIELRENVFEHPSYSQPGTSSCQKGLSILDMIFNCGTEQVTNWIGV